MDTPPVQTWLELNIKKNGRLEGTCPAATASNDRDEDGVPDDCDDCPFIHNPEQADKSLWPAEDDDLDGVGDACDTTPGGEPSSANANYEFELDAFVRDHQSLCGGAPELLGSGARVLIREGHYSNDTDLACAKGLFLSKFQADLADREPVSLAALSTFDGGQGVALPKGNLNPYQDAGIQAICAQSTCRWAERTQVDVVARASSDIEFADTKYAEVGLRWCDCDLGTTTVAGRRACQETPYNCTKLGNEFDNGFSQWLPIATTSDGQTWTADERFWSRVGSTVAKRTTWDFRSLPALSVKNPSPYHFLVNGVLWASTRDLKDAPTASSCG